jgi:hypothetical protein
MASPRALEELSKTALQKMEAQKEEEAKVKEMREKELEIMMKWELLRQLQAAEMVDSSTALTAGLQAERKKHAGMAPGMKERELLKYLKKQRKFLFLDGVPASEAPVLERKLPTGKKVKYTATDFCDLLGVVVDKYKAGALDSVLNPIEPVGKKLAKFDAFRGGSMTQQMQDYIKDERARLQSVVDEVQRQVVAGIKLYQKAQHTRVTSRRTAVSKPDKRLIKGAVVWVADEDDLDPEGDDCVWEATVVGPVKKKRGWYTLSFSGIVNTYDYIQYNIFFSEEDAKIDLLVD